MCGLTGAGPDGDVGERERSVRVTASREFVDDAHHLRQHDQLPAGMATSQVRQRLAQDRQQGLQRRDPPVPGLLLCGQGFQTTAVLCLEHHRSYGQTITTHVG